MVARAHLSTFFLASERSSAADRRSNGQIAGIKGQKERNVDPHGALPLVPLVPRIRIALESLTARNMVRMSQVL
jgi:hypothetical protein